MVIKLATPPPPQSPPDYDHLYDFTRTMLQGRLFIGDFQEKRYVSAIRSYRDVIVLSKEETELSHDLAVVRKRIMHTDNNLWVGITTPDVIGAPAGYCIWVELSEEVFGRYWYKIQSVKFSNREVILKVKAIRAVEVDRSDVCDGLNFGIRLEKISEVSKEDLYRFGGMIGRVVYLWLLNGFVKLKEVVTYDNLRESAVFMSILVCTLFVCGIHGVKYFMEYCLRFMRELSHIINSLTPIMICMIEMFTKIIGGFYMLLAMVWRDAVSGPPRRNNQPKMIRY